MPTRAAQKARTRERIVDQATRLCAARGFLELRTADVARAARLSHGAIFVHFPTREDLLVAVAARIGTQITERLHALASEEAPLRAVLKAHLACLREREEEYRWLVIEGPTLPAGFKSAWVGLQSAVAFHIAEAAEREMAQGRIRAMPVHLLFNTWIGLLHHYLANREQFSPRRPLIAALGEELLDHFLSLLRTRPERRRP
jgi:AcrR family transcriptional regulator